MASGAASRIFSDDRMRRFAAPHGSRRAGRGPAISRSHVLARRIVAVSLPIQGERMTRLPLATITSACMASLLMLAASATTASAPTAPAAAPDAGSLQAADQTFIAEGTQAVATQR